MKKIKYIAILLLGLIACEKDIELAINTQADLMVMYAFVHPDSTLNLHFSKSQSILSLDNYKQVEKGRFRIFINDNFQGTYILPSDTTWSKWPEFDYNAGDKLNITAYELNGDTVKIESYIPNEIPILNLDTLTIRRNVADVGSSLMLKSFMTFQDPQGESNFYQLFVVREGFGTIGDQPYYTRKVIDYEKADEVFTQGSQSESLLPGLDFQGLFNDEKIGGIKYKLTFEIPKDNMLFDYYEEKIKITIYLYHHTADYYQYFRSIILSDGYEGFYDGLPVFDPIKIHTNVENGLGLVSGMNFDSDSLVFFK
jgi:hypothetical protein